MDIFEAAERIVATINRELAEKDDPVRIRYMSVEPDSFDEDEWMVRTFWELPDNEGELWPRSTLRRYRTLADDRFAGTARTRCIFRSHDELEKPEHRTGWAVREPA